MILQFNCYSLNSLTMDLFYTGGFSEPKNGKLLSHHWKLK